MHPVFHQGPSQIHFLLDQQQVIPLITSSVTTGTIILRVTVQPGPKWWFVFYKGHNHKRVMSPHITGPTVMSQC